MARYQNDYSKGRKMKNMYFTLLAVIGSIGFGLFIACSSGSSGSGSDDDVADDDSGDDDSASADDDRIITDPSSGLTWYVEPALVQLSWEEAIYYCNKMAFSGGGWRMPTISELRTLIRGCVNTQSNGQCGATDECLNFSCWDESCYSCNDGEGPNDGCYSPSGLLEQCYSYWSSSSFEDKNPGTGTLMDATWIVDFNSGNVRYSASSAGIPGYLAVQCVR